MPHPRNTTIALSAVMLLGGCSFIFSEGPPKDTSRPFLACGESFVPPILDTLGATVWSLVLSGNSQQRPENVTDSEYHGMLVTTSLWLAVQSASAVYGYVAAVRCNDARQARNREMAQAWMLPPPYGAGPRGYPPPAWPPPNLIRSPAAAPVPVAPAPPPAQQPEEEPQVVPVTP
jgi:hypothetical protein